MNITHTFVDDGLEFTVEARVRSGSVYVTRTNSYFAKTRVYTNAESHPEYVAFSQDYEHGDRGLGLSQETVVKKLNRFFSKVSREIAKKAVGSLIEAGSIWNPGELVYIFDRNAGCSCGCSSGVVLNTRLLHDGFGIDIWVTVKVLEVTS